MKGSLFALEVGRNLILTDHSAFGYYGGLRRTSVKVDGYSESVPGFPFTYSGSRYTATSAFTGASYTHRLTDKVKWATTAEVEQDLSRKDPSLTARADYFGAQTFHGDFAKTRGSLSTALSYAFSDAVNVTFSPYVERTATRDTGYGAALRLSGTF